MVLRLVWSLWLFLARSVRGYMSKMPRFQIFAKVSLRWLDDLT